MEINLLFGETIKENAFASSFSELNGVESFQFPLIMLLPGSGLPPALLIHFIKFQFLT